MIPSVKALARMLECLNWTGHVELPTTDIQWLAKEIRKFMIGTPGKCAICNNAHTTTITTAIGAICTTCIEELHEEVA
jgi:hypothetical protein